MTRHRKKSGCDVLLLFQALPPTNRSALSRTQRMTVWALLLIQRFSSSFTVPIFARGCSCGGAKRCGCIVNVRLATAASVYDVTRLVAACIHRGRCCRCVVMILLIILHRRRG